MRTTANVRPLAMPPKDFVNAGVGQVGVGDDALGEAIFGSLLLQPFRLADRVAREAKRLHVNRFHNIEATDQRNIVGNKKVVSQLVIVAKQALHIRIAVAKPSIAISKVP